MASESPIKPKSTENLAAKIPLGIAGGIAGGVIGFFLFKLLLGQGLHFIVLAGAMVGFGCGVAARSRSFVFSLIALLIAIPTAIFYEWKTDKFLCDDGETLMGIIEYTYRMGSPKLRGWTLPVFIGLNGLLAFWLGRRG